MATLQVVEPVPVRLSPELEHHAKLRASQFRGHIPDSINAVQWITAAQPGLVLSDDGEGHLTYSFDASKAFFAADSTLAGAVEIACAIYNALPLESRTEQTALSSAVVAYDPTTCVPTGQVFPQWWGVRIHFDHCACNDIEFALVGAGSGAATAAGLLGIFGVMTGPAGLTLGGVLAIVCTAIAGAAATYAGAFTWADTQSGQGAFLNFTWASPGTPWVTPS